jgi:Periplasmic binding proteins and sugar binding domain of LacI family
MGFVCVLATPNGDRIGRSEVRGSSQPSSVTLHQGPRPVAPETEARVRDAIERPGYRPNLSARALRSGATDLIGLVLPDSSNPLFAELVQAVKQVAAQHGYALVMATSNFDGSVERQNVERLASRQIRGLVASGLNAGTWTSGTGAEFQPPCSTQTARCPGSTQSGRTFTTVPVPSSSTF